MSSVSWVSRAGEGFAGYRLISLSGHVSVKDFIGRRRLQVSQQLCLGKIEKVTGKR